MESQPSKACIIDTFQRAGKRVSVHCQVRTGCQVLDMKAPLRQVAKGLENKGTWKESSTRSTGNTVCKPGVCQDRRWGAQSTFIVLWPHGIVGSSWKGWWGRVWYHSHGSGIG